MEFRLLSPTGVMASTGIHMKRLVAIILLFMIPTGLCGNSKLFREYIGAEGLNVTFSEVPINYDVEFHFILAFAIDYTNSTGSPSPTNGRFNVFWDKENLSPSAVKDIRSKHSNVKVALSLGGDVVGPHDTAVMFKPASVASWVYNAVSTLTEIIEEYDLDGIDIDYEHFYSDPDTFAEGVGQLIVTLKQRNVISFASIAPFENRGPVQSHYLALWKKYGRFIDYVNFQFYAYHRGTTVEEFLKYYDIQVANYKGGKVLASFATDPAGRGLKPDKGFFDAAEKLKKDQKLEGIFIWSADDSKKGGFKYEKQSQALLAS